jgi:hypothetical protein
MTWYLDGSKITASYMDRVVTGTVQDSRVKYGGEVQHLVILDEPLQLPWRTDPLARVLIDESDVLEVVSK